MTKYYYTDFTAEDGDMDVAGSTLPTRPNENWKGNRVNNALRATNSALFNLGTIAAKLKTDSDGDPDLGPNNGQIGDLAFQDAADCFLGTGVLDFGMRGSVPIGMLMSWLGTYDQLVAEYNRLRLRGWDICDGRLTTNPYSPFNQVQMPNLLGRYVWFYDDPAFLTQGVFAHVKATSTDGSHSHGGTTGGVALTSAQVPALGTRNDVRADGGGATVVTGYGGAGAAHAHSIGADGSHAHTVDVRPASVVCVPLLRVW